MSLGNRAKTILDVASSVLVGLAAVALLWSVYESRSRSAAVVASNVQDVKDVTIDGAAAAKRSGRGPVAIVEFSDFQCPFCGQFARDTFPDIRKKLIDSGKVTYIAFALPLQMHPLAAKAGEAAECAAREGKYWEMHDVLFSEPLRLTPPDLVSAATTIGLDMARFEPCFANEAREAVAADMREATRLKVAATPSFFVGKLRGDGKIEVFKRISGALPYQAFAEAVESVSKL